jgi:hypothetical protein
VLLVALLVLVAMFILADPRRIGRQPTWPPALVSHALAA